MGKQINDELILRISEYQLDALLENLLKAKDFIDTLIKQFATIKADGSNYDSFKETQRFLIAEYLGVKADTG